MKKIIITILLACVGLMLFFLLLKNSYAYLDPDLGWHLKVGQDILEKGDAPRLNHYNYTLLNEAWIDHEWLMEVLIYTSYKYSYLFLHILFVFIVFLAFFLALIPVFKKNKNYISVIIASLLPLTLGIYFSTPSFGLRPQVFALFFTASLLLILFLYEKSYNWRYLLILPLLFFIWANLHGSFILGLGLFLVWYLMKIVLANNYIYKFISKHNLNIGNLFNKKEKIIVLLFLITSIIFTFINPYGLGLYNSLFEYTNTFYLKYIAEWIPQFAYPFIYNQLIFLTISFSLVFIYIIELKNKRKKYNLWQFFLFFFFFILAFKSRRHFPLFVIVNIAFFAEILLFYGQEFIKLKPKRLFFILNSLIVIFLGLFLSYNYYINTNWHEDPFIHFCHRYPCEAVEFLKNNQELDNLNIYNNYGWGGYMIWKYPERLLFIDGRMPHYPYDNRSILEEYSDFRTNDEKLLEKLINKHNIKIFLIKSQERKINFKKWEKFLFGFKDKNIVNDNPLRTYLKDSNDWQNIYEDNLAIIFKKINN
jgi:hypothetical protein